MGHDLGIAGATTDEVYQAMDWLKTRQPVIEQALARKWLTDPTENPGKLVLYDLTSTWVEGTKCELADFGYSRDKKRGRAQIEFALITNPTGIPVAVRTFPGNTSDPTACGDAITAIRDQFQMTEAVLVGDRGMVTGTRIDELRGIDGIGWIGALKHAQIAALAKDGGPLRPSLFDQTGVLAIEHPDYPTERLIACYNPYQAEYRKAKRDRLIAATLADLDKIAVRVEKGRLKAEHKIGLAVGKVIDRHKVARLVTVTIGPGSIEYGRNTIALREEALIDGIYVIRTSVPDTQLTDAQIVASYKQLANVEKDFAWIKGVDITVRPIRHWLVGRVEAHLMICLLAAILTWHLRQAWRPLTFTDEHPTPPAGSAQPARRSTAADRKASTRHNTNGQELRSFHSLLGHLSVMTRNVITITTTTGPVSYEQITQPTTTQAEAFRLIGTPIPCTLTGR